MYMYKLISFALVGAASAMASGLSCKAYGVAGNLVSLDFFHHDSQLLEFTLDKTVDGHPALASTQHSKQLFQFFSCNSPSKHYKKGGQVRSLMNTSLCLTPGTVYLPSDKMGDAMPYPENADNRISLQPCESEHSLQLRKQWFMETETNKAGLVQVSQQGWRSDSTSDTLIITDDGVALTSHPDKGTEPRHLHIKARV
ncbi:hypothetical protein MARU1_003297 [Malassezia arunalokei]|uniref:Ricin B lectin domain-containing protein n=1 Tax=Malassezia arunalokei TaxID=1514897 RepID=A0AAJ5Z3I5_9BASI|nr:hypothetical protein MARU1_003297 [Malassezia arunalokei]